MNPMLGIGSGLDLSTMLDGLVRVASEPKINQLGRKEVEARDAISGLGTLNSLLSSFKTASDALKDSSSYGGRLATVTQPSAGDVISVSADSTAVEGNVDVIVDRVAQGSAGYTRQVNPNHGDALGKTDTLTFNTADASQSFTIAVDASMSLNDIRDAINDSSDNFGVSVNIVDGRLSYSSSVTGSSAAKDLQVSSANTDADFVIDTYTQNAQDARIYVDGIEVVQDSNTFEGVITGLTITALKESAGDSAEVSVALDKDSVKSKINAFADAYNKLREGMNTLKGSYDEDNEQFTAGKLSGDPIVRNIESILGGLLTQQVGGAASGVDTLYAVGMDIQSDGTISVDSDRLDATLANNFDDLEKLFSDTSSTDGVAYKISESLDSFLGFSGVIQDKENSYNDIIKDLESQYEAHARYIEGYQKTLIKQFTALDSTMARLQATMSQVGPQLAALANVSYSSGS